MSDAQFPPSPDASGPAPTGDFPTAPAPFGSPAPTGSGGTPPPPPPPPSHLQPPPGYVAYGAGQYGAFSPYDRIKGVARWAGILVLVSAALNLLSTLLTLGLSNDAQAFLDGDITQSEFISRYGPVLMVGGLGSAVGIAAGVVTIIWMYRVASNHRKLGRGGTWGAGWAIGGWFAPPVLYVIPFLMMRQLWRGSDPSIGPNDARWRTAPVSPIVTLWWALYGLIPALMIPIGIGSALSRGFGGDMTSTAEQASTNMGITIVGTLTQVGAAVAFFVLVKQLTARQTQLTREA